MDAFRQSGLDVKVCTVDAGGLVVPPSESVVPRLIYLTPCFQYPLGMPLGAERREILLEMSRQHDCVVFEDDYDSEFRDDSPPRPALAAEAAPMNALIQALDNAHIGAQPLEHLDWSNRQPARCKAIVIGLGNVETLAIPATVTRLTTALASVR